MRLLSAEGWIAVTRGNGGPLTAVAAMKATFRFDSLNSAWLRRPDPFVFTLENARAAYSYE